MWSIHSATAAGLVKSCFTSQPVCVCVRVCAGVCVCVCVCVRVCAQVGPAGQSKEKEEVEEESDRMMGYICWYTRTRAYVRRYAYE